MLDGVPDPRRRGDLWVESPTKTRVVANCSENVSPMLPRGKYKQDVGWACYSDFVFCQITSLPVFSDCSRARILPTLAVPPLARTRACVGFSPQQRRKSPTLTPSTMLSRPSQKSNRSNTSCTSVYSQQGFSSVLFYTKVQF